MRALSPCLPATLCNDLRLHGTARGRALGWPGCARSAPGGLKRQGPADPRVPLASSSWLRRTADGRAAGPADRPPGVAARLYL